MLVVKRFAFLEYVPWAQGKWPGVDQAERKVTDVRIQNCDQPEQTAEGGTFNPGPLLGLVVNVRILFTFFKKKKKSFEISLAYY